MSTTELNTLARDLKELRLMAEQLDAEIKTIEDAIKAHMTEHAIDTLITTDVKMCMRDDKVQAKLRVTLNLIHTLSKALSVSATLESDLADTAAFNCSELILRAAIELHNHVSAALNNKEDDHHA